MKRDVGYYKAFLIYESMPGLTKFLYCWFLGFWGYQHFKFKDWFGLILHFGISFVFFPIFGILLMLLFSWCFGSSAAALGIGVGMGCGGVYCAIPVYLLMHYYFENGDGDFYLEALKNKKSWPFINRMLMIVPKNQK